MGYIPTRLREVDDRADEMVSGLDIGRAAGYKKPRHFVESYYYGAAITREEVAPGIVSCQGSAAHFYLIDGCHVVTHPDSACAAKENVREKVRLDPVRRLQFDAVRWQRHYTDVSGAQNV